MLSAEDNDFFCRVDQDHPMLKQPAKECLERGDTARKGLGAAGHASTRSMGSTASAPGGSGAPVMIVTASPGPSGRP